MAVPGNAAPKGEWRAYLQRERRALPGPVRDAEAEALAHAVTDLPLAAGDTVCGYVPLPTEPGSVAMLDRLRAVGARVLLPVTVPDAPLHWAPYQGPDSLRTGAFGVAEPVAEPLPPEAVRRAGIVLVPALAVDRAGIRLGRGGGFYDRTLPLVAESTLVIAVVRDAELVDTLPAEPHDRRVSGVLTPGQGFRPCGGPHGI